MVTERYELKNGNLFVLAEAAGGVYNAGQLKLISEVAEEVSAFLKITEDQRLGFMIPRDRVDDLQGRLSKAGVLLKHYRSQGPVSPKACLGQLCPKCEQDALGDAIEISPLLNDKFKSSLAVMNIGMNGCSTACVGSATDEVHIVGEKGGYRVYIGGRSLHPPKLAELAAEQIPRRRIGPAIADILELYANNKQDEEKLSEVLARIGMEAFTKVLAKHLSGEDVAEEPAVAVDEVPVEVAAEAPAVAVDEAPVEVAAEAPAVAVDEAPVEVAAEAPAVAVDEAPVEVAAEEPAVTVDEAPLEVAAEEPAVTVDEAPLEVAAEENTLQAAEDLEPAPNVSDENMSVEDQTAELSSEPVVDVTAASEELPVETLEASASEVQESQGEVPVPEEVATEPQQVSEASEVVNETAEVDATDSVEPVSDQASATVEGAEPPAAEDAAEAPIEVKELDIVDDTSSAPEAEVSEPAMESAPVESTERSSAISEGVDDNGLGESTLDENTPEVSEAALRSKRTRVQIKGAHLAIELSDGSDFMISFKSFEEGRILEMEIEDENFTMESVNGKLFVKSGEFEMHIPLNHGTASPLDDDDVGPGIDAA